MSSSVKSVSPSVVVPGKQSSNDLSTRARTKAGTAPRHTVKIVVAGKIPRLKLHKFVVCDDLDLQRQTFVQEHEVMRRRLLKHHLLDAGFPRPARKMQQTDRQHCQHTNHVHVTATENVATGAVPSAADAASVQTGKRCHRRCCSDISMAQFQFKRILSQYSTQQRTR
jgi:hypothetical protein